MTGPSGTEAVGFRAGHAAGTDWQSAIEGALAALGVVPEGATLGFVYVSDALVGDLAAVVDHLKAATGVEHWVGTVGLGVCGTGREYFGEPAAAVMLASLPRDSFRVLPAIRGDAAELPRPLARWIDAVQPSLGLVHADPRQEALPALIGDLADRTRAFLVGGLSSSYGPMPQVADAPIEDAALSGVLFGPGVAVATGLSQGCTPLGPTHTVTRAVRNFAVEVDGRPALEVLLEDAGAGDASDIRRALADVHVALPVAGSDRNDYLVRNLIGIDPEHAAVALGALVDPGDRLIFVRRDRRAAEQDLRRMLADMRRRLPGPVAGGVYVSCLARGPNLFGAGSRELGVLCEEIGEVPLVGFFANGEIAGGRLYGYTGVLTLFCGK